MRAGRFSSYDKVIHRAILLMDFLVYEISHGSSIKVIDKSGEVVAEINLENIYKEP